MQKTETTVREAARFTAAKQIVQSDRYELRPMGNSDKAFFVWKDGDLAYMVYPDTDSPEFLYCDCPDFAAHRDFCKHTFAVKIQIEMEEEEAALIEAAERAEEARLFQAYGITA